MSREKSSNRTAIPAKHALEHVYREPISFGEPTMFWVDEARLQEYLRLELERRNKSDKRA
jgi:hypothetical protein